MKALSSGRVVVIGNQDHRNAVGVVLSSSTASKERTFKTLVLCNPSDDTTTAKNDDQAKKLHVEPLQKKPLFRPDGPCGHIVLDLLGEDIAMVTTMTIKIASDRIIDDFKKRQIPRFRYEPVRVRPLVSQTSGL